MDRDSKGRFIKGRSETQEEKLKRLISIEENVKSRKGYIGDIKNENPRIFNTWRSILYTEKGKKVGCSDEWKNFRVFYNDVSPTYQKGLVFRRLDITKPFSKENFIWVTQEEAAMLQSNLVWLEYNGEKMPLKYWADKYNLNLQGLRNRYFKRNVKNYSIEEIIFGRTKKRGTKIPNNNALSRMKASKMISAYRLKDKRNGVPICDIDIDWMISNITTKPCFYCGDTNRIGCDRIDNSKGHTKDNVVPCCYDCNCARNDNFSHEEMIILGKTISEIKSKRSKTLK